MAPWPHGPWPSNYSNELRMAEYIFPATMMCSTVRSKRQTDRADYNISMYEVNFLHCSSGAHKRPTDGLINMERARRASAAAAHAAWEALRGRAPAVPDDPLGADDVDVVDGDDEIVVARGRGQLP